MPSADSFGHALGLVVGAPVGNALWITKKQIGHDAVTPNRDYVYPISITIGASKPPERKRAAKRKRSPSPPSDVNRTTPTPQAQAASKPVAESSTVPSATLPSSTAEVHHGVVTESKADRVGGPERGDMIATVKRWMAELCQKRLAVWTFYGNPYDIWVEDTFTVEQPASMGGGANYCVVKATGRGIRNFSVQKKPRTRFTTASKISAALSEPKANPSPSPLSGRPAV